MPPTSHQRKCDVDDTGMASASSVLYFPFSKLTVFNNFFFFFLKNQSLLELNDVSSGGSMQTQTPKRFLLRSEGEGGQL